MKDSKNHTNAAIYQYHCTSDWPKSRTRSVNGGAVHDLHKLIQEATMCVRVISILFIGLLGLPVDSLLQHVQKLIIVTTIVVVIGVFLVLMFGILLPVHL